MCVYEACDMRENFLPAETDFGDEVLSGGRVQEILGKQLEEYLGENKVHTTAYEKERRVKVQKQSQRITACLYCYSKNLTFSHVPR